jgi:glycosyltransferase involved in cell wall biosynthesis
MLKILHVPYTYYPDPVGGTEIYVEQLVQGLSALNIENIVVAPGKTNECYEHRGVMVQRIPVDNDVRDLNQLYGEGDEEAARFFGTLLHTHQPDIVHLHAYTRIVSARLAQQAQARNIRVVFTYHTPTASCLRSGLMLWGREACDGVLDADRCTRCRLHSLGLPKPVATLMARVPQPLREWGNDKQGGVWTALRMRELVARQHAAFHFLMAQVDVTVALCEWTRQLLLNNAVPPEKILVVPHGLKLENEKPLPLERDTVRQDGLRVVMLGRLEPIKGVDLLVRALEELPNAPITLDIYGIMQSESETSFARQLRQWIVKDKRIRLLPPVPHAQVIPLLQHYDLLAVPSQWFETGPLVVLEAFAAGIPVLGSDLGGIAEKVIDGVNGMLVHSLDANAWRQALHSLSQDRTIVERMRANVRPPRSVSAVAQEMADLYARVART